LCSVSRRPIWAGTRSDNLLVGPGTPRGRNADTSENSFSFGSLASLVELEPFYKSFGKTVSFVFLLNDVLGK
jgi:hypothetical protein